jgi:hypothetical protein
LIDVLAIIGGAVVVYLAYVYIKFSAFKSKLMNEFGRRAILYEVADHFYTEARHLINTMHADGQTITSIVDEVTVRYPELF